MKELINDIKEINNKQIINLFYNIGNTIKDIDEVYFYLRDLYGITVIFSRHNLCNMRIFSNLYKEEDLVLLEQLDWRCHLIILDLKINRLKSLNYVKKAIKYNMNLRELEYFIKNKKYINIDYIKLSNIESELEKVTINS